jgi:epsilon-lactone hydrolase
MSAKIHFCGPARYRLRSEAELIESIVEVFVRRMLKGPRRPNWNWFVEVATSMAKKQVNTALKMPDVKEARRYLDSVVFSSPALSEVNITSFVDEKFRGSWFSRKNAESPVTVLYFHGGGYSFYPQAYTSFIAQITLAANSRTFALDYRLSPEHRFPAQLDDALNAYQWLLESGSGTDPDHLILAGDSAGGNLTLAVLLQARDLKLPLPALAIALSPPTNFDSDIVSNDFDWIDKPAFLRWRNWFCDPAQCRNPLVSPLWADLRNLPPIYIQAGSAEILYHSIRAFAEHGKNQGADVVLESWEDMNHNFQIFGHDAPQSADALRRIGQVVDARVRGRAKKETTSCSTGDRIWTAKP